MTKRNSFEEIVRSLPDEILLTADNRAELLDLSRAADREAERAKAGDPDHALGVAMARYLVRFTELVGAGDPGASDHILAELRAVVAEAEERTVDDFPRALDGYDE